MQNDTYTTSWNRFRSLGAWVAVLVLLALASGCSSIAYQMRLSESDLQDEVEDIFPVEADLAVTKLALVAPHVQLRSGSKRVYLGVDAQAEGPLGTGLVRLATIQISGELDYRPKTRELVLVRPQVDDIDFAVIGSSRAQQPVFEVLNVLLRTLDGLPVYNIEKNESAVVSWAIQDIEVHGKEVIVTLGN